MPTLKTYFNNAILLHTAQLARWGRFAAHLSLFHMFTPAQPNYTEQGNEPEFELIELNKEGVKAP